MIGEAFASGTLPLPTDTIRVIELKILLALRGIGSGSGSGSGAGFVLTYTNNPNIEGLTPTNVSAAALAYQHPYVDQPVYSWDKTNHVWV